MDKYIKKIDKLIRSVISCAIPSNESFQFLPPFLDKILTALTKNSYSLDKKTRFSAAICITALINLLPNDENA